jgi:SNF2-related domain/Helicase conserved C-terminal domain
MSPTGQVLLNAQKSDLTKMGFSNDLAKKVEQHLKVARQAQALKENKISPAAAAASTPLVDGPSAQEVDLATDPGPSGPKPRGRGRPLKSHQQSRLSQRLEVASQAEDAAASDEEEPAAAAAGKDDDDSSDYEEDAEDPASPDVGRRRTRQRSSRVAAVQRAQGHIKTVEKEILLEDNEDDEEENVASDSSSDEEEVAPAATRRGGRGGRATARGRTTTTAAAVEEVVEEEEEEIDDRPEEPDDGVHHRNGHKWEDAAREGLEDILKQLSFDTLKHIVDEELFGNPMHFYKYRTKDRYGDMQTKTRSRGYVAQKIVKQLLDGWLQSGKAEDGGTTPEGVDDLLDKYVPEQYVVAYLNNILLKRFATPPKISDTRRLLWRLWCTPVPTEGPDMASLGQITFPVVRIGAFLREYWDDIVECWEDPETKPFMTTLRMNAAFRKQDDLIAEYEMSVATAQARAAAGYGGSAAVNGVKPDPDAIGNNNIGGMPSSGGNAPQREIVFEETNDDDPHDWDDLFEQLLNMQGRMNISIQWRLDIRKMKLFGEVVVDLKGTKGDVLVQAAFDKKHADESHELVQIWLDKILQAMDHLQGSELLDTELEALNVAWDDAITDLEAKDVELTLDHPRTVDIRIFDQIMAGVENLERPMEAGVEADCRAHIALKLKPYQKRALSFLLREERAPAGTSRHLWLKVPLPGNQPGVECYMSPSLFQLYISKSPTATGIALGNTGGGGWQALEMGMGKTAVMIAGIIFNPVPDGWRNKRPWTPYNPEDYMLTKTENMPRGGTLVVVPTSLVRQWEIEIAKTLKNPDALSTLRWTDARRTNDCNEIALFDVVITTPQQVTKDATLSSIYWHRVVVDEAQLNAGSLMQSGILISTHRWIVSGTPCNSHPESLRPSLEFLRLGGYSDAQKHLPPALATVMRAVMCRYTKDGTIEGEKNLQLKALVEKNISCTLDDLDREDEKDLSRKAYMEFNQMVARGMKKAGCPPEATIEGLLANPVSLNTVAQHGHINTLAARRKMQEVRAVVAGGHPVIVPGEFKTNLRTGEEEAVYRYFQSKAQHVVACIVQVHTADPTAKVLVFSEYEETLKSIANILPEWDLGCRAIYGSTSAKKRGEDIEAFMTDPPTKIFLLVAKSAAVGITLTAANHVFICEPLLNPAVEAQAIGRSQRMGQEKQVTVHRMFTKDTIEERVRQFVARKHGGPSTEMASTAMAANPGAGEVQCNLADTHTLLKVDLGDSDDEEEDDMVIG